MLKNLKKNSRLNIIIFGNLGLVLALLIATMIIISYQQSKAFRIESIKVLELKLPSLDLEKYRQLEKKQN